MLDEILLAIINMEVRDTLEYRTSKGILRINMYITDTQEVEFKLYDLHMQEVEKITCDFDDEELEETLYYFVE